MSDQGSTGGDVWTVSSNGKGEPTNVTPGIDGTPTFISWTGNDSIGFTERRGHMRLVDYNVTTRKQDAVDDLGEVSVSGGAIKNSISVSNHGALAMVKSSYNLAPEIWVGQFGKLQQLTHLNTTTAAAPRFESIEWENEGFHVQGWLTFPKDFDASKKYPLIVEVHGGPSASAGPRPSTMWSDQGYFVPSRPTRCPAALVRVRPSPPPTGKTSATATSATSSRAWTPSRPNTPSTRTAKASPAGATAAS